MTSTTGATMNTTTTADRTFTLAKDGISIIVIQHGDTPTWTWSVLQGWKQITSGLLHSDMPLIELLKHIADNTTMPTVVGDIALRALTWEALNNCEHVPASELRAGDVVSLHGYGLVIESAETDGDNVIITTGSMGYHSAGTRRCMPRTQLCNLIQRGAA